MGGQQQQGQAMGGNTMPPPGGGRFNYGGQAYTGNAQPYPGNPDTSWMYSNPQAAYYQSMGEPQTYIRQGNQWVRNPALDPWLAQHQQQIDASKQANIAAHQSAWDPNSGLNYGNYVNSWNQLMGTQGLGGSGGGDTAMFNQGSLQNQGAPGSGGFGGSLGLLNGGQQPSPGTFQSQFNRLTGTANPSGGASPSSGGFVGPGSSNWNQWESSPGGEIYDLNFGLQNPGLPSQAALVGSSFDQDGSITRMMQFQAQRNPRIAQWLQAKGIGLGQFAPPAGATPPAQGAPPPPSPPSSTAPAQTPPGMSQQAANQQVQQWFQRALGRSPGQGGEQFFSNELMSGMSPSQVLGQIRSSPEWHRRHG